MNCSQCGREVPDGAGFCRHCGASLDSGRAAPPPPPQAAGYPPHPDYPPPPGYPPPGPLGPGQVPPPQGGNRTLVIVLLATLVVLALLALGAVALLIARQSGSGTAESTATVGSMAPPSTSPDQTTPSSDYTDTTMPPLLAEGEWVQVAVPQPPGEVYSVAVSDEVVAIDTADGILAGMIEGDRVEGLVPLPMTMGQTGIPTAEGRLVAWWEGEFDEGTGELTDQAIYAMLLPDGQKVQVVAGEGMLAFPQLSGDHLLFIEPTAPGGDMESEVWEEPISWVPIAPDGSPRGEPELLTSAPRAFVMGDGTWSYAFSDPYLIWEQHEDAEGLAAGVQAMDLRTRETRQVAPAGAGRATLSDSTVVFWYETLRSLDLTGGQERALDPAGDWAAGAPGCIAYLRTVEGDASRWDVVARSLSTDYEQVLGSQTTPPWLSAPLAVSSRHVAFVTDDGKVELFQWRER